MSIASGCWPTRLLTMSGRYLPFWQVTRAGLRFAAARLALALTPAAEAQLMNQYRHLSAFPENRDVLVELQRRGVVTGVLSNGDPEMLAVAVKSAGLTALLPHLLSVQGVRRYKTDPAAYAIGPHALNLPARDILFVSSNSWDVIGATWYGYTTLWVNRARQPLDPLDTAPTHIGNSLRDVLNFFPKNKPAHDHD